MISIFPERFADRVRQIFRRDMRGGRRFLGELCAPQAHALVQAGAPGGNARLRHLQAGLDRRGQRFQRLDRPGLYGEVARE